MNWQSLSDVIKLVLRNEVVTGSDIKRLERTFDHMYGTYKTLLLGSGRLGIYLFLKVLRKHRSRKREVIVPFYICSSVISTVKASGYNIKYVGIKPDLNIDIGDVLSENLENVAAIIVPHIYGAPADIIRLKEELYRSGVKVPILDDAAAAFNIRMNSNILGTLGDVGIISFSQGKLINSSGGGALLINNEDYLEDLIFEYSQLPVNSWSDKIADFFLILWKYGLQRYSITISYWVSKFFKNVHYTYKSSDKQITNLDARIINNLLPEITMIHQKMRRIIRFYVRNVKSYDLPIEFPQVAGNGFASVVSKLCCRIILDNSSANDGSIISDLKRFMLQRGIKIYVPYRPAMGQSATYYEYWKNNSWINNMFILPVDYQRDINWHSYILDQLIDYFTRLR